MSLSEGSGLARSLAPRNDTALAQVSQLIDPENPELGRTGGGLSPFVALSVAIVTALVTAGLYTGAEAFMSLLK